MLSQVLAEKRTNLDAAMRAIEAKIANSKSLDSDVGYAITALNDINQTLYFLLESEKKSLNQAKKNCHVDKLIEKWSPYKTVASLILWKSIEEKYFYA